MPWCCGCCFNNYTSKNKVRPGDQDLDRVKSVWTLESEETASPPKPLVPKHPNTSTQDTNPDKTHSNSLLNIPHWARSVVTSIQSLTTSISLPRQKPKTPLASTTVRVDALTWNVHGRGPPDAKHLEAFLARPSAASNKKTAHNKKRGFHVIAIGLQECPSNQEWTVFMDMYLDPEFVRIGWYAMGGIQLMVYVFKEVSDVVRDVQVGAVPTGFGNVFGNKGGVAVGFRLSTDTESDTEGVYNGTGLLFVNSHLAAHDRNVKARNADYQRICKGLTSLTGPIPNSDDVTQRFHYTVWMGDLNYRINGTRKHTEALLGQKMFDILLANDQLGIERRQGNVFWGFQEGQITFPPTYKFDTDKTRRRSRAIPELEMESSLAPEEAGGDVIKRKVSRYDSSAKQRVPSWTDRVLFRQHPGIEGDCITVSAYNTCMDINWSDHKPVYAHLSIDIDRKS